MHPEATTTRFKTYQTRQFSVKEIWKRLQPALVAKRREPWFCFLRSKARRACEYCLLQKH